MTRKSNPAYRNALLTKPAVAADQTLGAPGGPVQAQNRSRPKKQEADPVERQALENFLRRRRLGLDKPPTW